MGNFAILLCRFWNTSCYVLFSEIGQIYHNYLLMPNNRLFSCKIFQISNAVIPYWADRKYLPFSAQICFILWAFSISMFPSAQIPAFVLSLSSSGCLLFFLRPQDCQHHSAGTPAENPQPFIKYIDMKSDPPNARSKTEHQRFIFTEIFYCLFI